jgi:Ca-activated chloride channel family protein
VQVDFNADVVARYRLIGYENRAVADSDFRNDQVDAGEIGAGHTVTALYAVQFRSGEGRIATVQLRWQDPDTREIVEINGNFNTWDLSSSFRSTSAYYQLDVIVAQFAEILRDSPYAYHMSLSALTEYAYSLPGLIPDDPDVAEFVDLVYNASKIRR